jgi:hypothetical protein
MQPIDFCNLAERLIQNEKNPEGFRSAISRAYYGAFLQARDFLERLSIYLISGNKHEEIRQILSNTGDADVDFATGLLVLLRDQRNGADYDVADRSVEVEAEAQAGLDRAREIIAKLNGCRLGPSRLAVVAAQVRANVNRLRGLPP